MRLPKYNTGYSVLFIFTVILVIFHVNNFIRQDFGGMETLIIIFLPFLLTVGIFGGCIWLWKQNIDQNYVLRVAMWSIGAAGIFVIGSVLTIYYLTTQNIQIATPVVIHGNTASGGAVIGFVVGVYDYRQRRAQAEATQLTQQITVLNRVLRHDIRNRVNIIQGNAELLIENPVEGSTYAHEINEQVSELIKISNHAKDIEEVIHEDNNKDVVDITSRIEAVCEGINREYPDAEINISVQDSLLVETHPLIDSALTNAIQNGIEHNDNKIPKIGIESNHLSDAANWDVEIKIADNGLGIPENEVSVLTQGYETDLDHLSGLGLWLINWVITSSGGEIKFEANYPEGSIVYLWFNQPQD